MSDCRRGGGGRYDSISGLERSDVRKELGEENLGELMLCSRVAFGGVHGTERDNAVA